MTGEYVRTLSGHSHWIYSVCFSPDEQYVLSGSVDSSMKLWNFKTGKYLRTFKGNRYNLGPVCFSPDGILAFSGQLNLWNIKKSKYLRSFKGHTDPVKSVCFSHDGKYSLSSAEDFNVPYPDCSVKLWEVSTGKCLRIFEGHTFYPLSAGFSPAGDFALSAAYYGQEKILDLKVWDIETGKCVRSFEQKAEWIDAVCYSPDARYALSGSTKGNLELWDLETGERIHTLEGHHDHIYGICFSPDGRYALSGSWGKTIKLWDVKKGEYIRTFEGHTDHVNAVCFSPDGIYALSESGDNTLRLWEVETGKEVRIFATRQRTWNGAGVDFSPDGKYIISGSKENTMRIWNIANDEWVSFILNSYESKWVIYTNEGYWDSSHKGGDFVAMVQGIEVWNIDQFAVRNNRPDIILKRLGSSDRNLIKHYYAQYKKRLKRLGFKEDQLSDDYHIPETKITGKEENGKYVSLSFNVSDTKYNLKTYNIFVNDVPLFGAYGKSVSGKSKALTEKIELTSGENKIEVSCMNEKGAESYRALTFADYEKKVKGDLYFVGFGVSEYKNKDLNLKYADKDVKDIAGIFNTMKGQYNKVYIRTYLNKEVTPSNIKKAKRFLENAKVDDTFVLFISGYGVHDRDEYATYYYLTHNTDLNNLGATAADFDLIEDLMQGIALRKKLFLMDTCESGEVDNDTQEVYYVMADAKGIRSRTSRRGLLIKEKEKRNYLYEKDRYIYNDLLRRSGAIVFSSCRGGEFSYESDALKNGLFTEEIIAAISEGRADADGNGIVTTDELRDYVSKAVPEHCRGMQNPTVDRDNIYVKFGFHVGY